MTDTAIIRGLEAKYSQISAEVVRTEDYLRRLLRDMDVIDAALLVLCADAERDAQAPVRRYFKGRGAQLTRHVLDGLREAPDATPEQLARRIMGDQELDAGDDLALRILTERVRKCVDKCRKRGMLKPRGAASSLSTGG